MLSLFLSRNNETSHKKKVRCLTKEVRLYLLADLCLLIKPHDSDLRVSTTRADFRIFVTAWLSQKYEWVAFARSAEELLLNDSWLVVLYCNFLHVSNSRRKRHTFGKLLHPSFLGRCLFGPCNQEWFLRCIISIHTIFFILFIYFSHSSSTIHFIPSWGFYHSSTTIHFCPS